MSFLRNKDNAASEDTVEWMTKFAEMVDDLENIYGKKKWRRIAENQLKDIHDNIKEIMSQKERRFENYFERDD